MDGTFAFTPVSMTSSKYPKHENKKCSGRDLSGMLPSFIRSQKKLDLTYIADAYKTTSVNEGSFFLENGFFEKLAGTSQLREQIEDGLSNEEIRESWEVGLSEFREIRNAYLIYP